MSKDIIVLTPNGRRQTVKCSLNTTILQILEEVCKKQGFDPNCYDLTHHNKLLDLTNTMRFSNLPNKASLEMAETDRRREETDITIALQLESDERRTGEFKPLSSLYEVLQSLASLELQTAVNPTVIYMRREVHGRKELQGITLRQLGLTGGRAVLRLIDKSLEELRTQANVSSTLPSRSVTTVEPLPDETISNTNQNNLLQPEQTVTEPKEHITRSENCMPGPSNATKPFTQMLNPIKLIKDEMKRSANVNAIDEREEEKEGNGGASMEIDEEIAQCSNETCTDNKSEVSQLDEELLQRRLNIENEITFIGERKAIAFEQSCSEPQLAELPDDFYDLTVEEVRKLYHKLRQSVNAISNAPLLTAGQRALLNNNEKHSAHKNAVIRVQFPDRMILQGVFEPSDTIEQVYCFTKQHLGESDRPFNLFTTPTCQTLEPGVSLQDAGFVPGVLMHFRWADGASEQRCLRQDIYENITSSDAAAILASKYRAPVRQKRDIPQEQGRTATQPGPSCSKDGKLPKWLKM